MRLRFMWLASLLVGAACSSSFSGGVPTDAPDAGVDGGLGDPRGPDGAQPNEPDAAEAKDAAPDGDAARSPCDDPSHVFCEDFDGRMAGATVADDPPDDAGTIFIGDPSGWVSPPMSGLAQVLPMKNGIGRQAAFVKGFPDLAGTKVDLSFDFSLVASDLNDNDNDVVMATFFVGGIAKYAVSLRIHDDYLYLGEPALPDGGKELHRDQALHFESSAFGHVHLGIDLKTQRVTLDDGTTNPVYDGPLAQHVASDLTGSSLHVGIVGATPPLTSQVAFRIDNIALDASSP